MNDADTSSLNDLIRPQERKHRRRRRRRFRWARRIKKRITRLNWLLLVILVLGVVTAIVMGTLVLAINARNEVYDAWQGVDRVMTSINNKPGTELTLTDFDLLQLSINDLTSSLANARSQVSFLRRLAFLSADLETSLDSMDAAYDLTLAARDVLTGLQPAISYLTEGEDDQTVTVEFSSGERTVELLSLGRSRFLSAERHLAAAKAKIDSMNLAEVSPDLLVTVDSLSRFHSKINDYNSLLLDSPELLSEALGLTETKTYLILSQNSDELRPSGGYISTYGWMTVRKGRVEDFEYYPRTDTTPKPPDASLGSELDIPDWWIPYSTPVHAAWDGSWYVDFPSTAELAAWYYDNGRNPHAPVDGVISVDIAGFEYFLEGLGGVTVQFQGETDTVTSESFRDVIYDIRTEGEHKAFLAVVYHQILNDWQAADNEQNAELRRVVLQALQEKHIMVHFTDDSLNEAFSVLGWSGTQKPAVDRDYLLVADANVGANKSNSSINRQLIYDVEILPDGSLNSRLSVGYDYSARTAENDPAVRPEHYRDINYYSIQQVFVPANSTLINTNNSSFETEVVESDTHTEFVTFMHVDYDDTERLVFSYETPVVVESFGNYRRYKLQLQKQPGMRAEPVNVQVRLPASASTIHISPSPDARYNIDQPILEFRLELLEDKSIEIIYTLPEE